LDHADEEADHADEETDQPEDTLTNQDFHPILDVMNTNAQLQTPTIIRQTPQPHPSPMSNTPDNQSVRLRIWQENLNKSDIAQHCILSGPITAKDFDIIAIQEPCIDDLGNTKATPDWNVI